MIVRNDLENIHHGYDCTLRDKIMHEQQVLEIESASKISRAAEDALSCDCGINRRSVFDRLLYFDLTKCFMHDLMHVATEGVLNNCSALLLKHLVHFIET
jgi:hypothetical protein